MALRSLQISFVAATLSICAACSDKHSEKPPAEGSSDTTPFQAKLQAGADAIEILEKQVRATFPTDGATTSCSSIKKSPLKFVLKGKDEDEEMYLSLRKANDFEMLGASFDASGQSAIDLLATRKTVTVMRISEYVAPKLDGRESFKPGSVRGTIAVFSLPDVKLLCSQPFAATNQEKVSESSMFLKDGALRKDLAEQAFKVVLHVMSDNPK